MVLTQKPRRWQVSLPSKSTVEDVARRYALLTVAVVLSSISFVSFQMPHNLSAGGLGSLSLIMSHYTGWSTGFSFWLMNVPMIILGFFTLGRWQFLTRTLYAATLFPLMINFFAAVLPTVIDPFPMTDNLLLNTIYAGVVGGIGSGLLFKAKGSLGSTSVLTLIIQKKTGMPITNIYFISDGIIILFAGWVFGWEAALYGFVMLFVYGVVTDHVLEGVSRTVNVHVVTQNLDGVKQAMYENFQKGVSYWEITGGYTGEKRYMVMSTILRSRIGDVKQVIADVDEKAFVTMEMSQQTFGEGFSALKPRTFR